MASRNIRNFSVKRAVQVNPYDLLFHENVLITEQGLEKIKEIFEMVNRQKILYQAMISEKATTLQEKANCYVFRVATDANKLQIKQAVEKSFSVKVKECRHCQR